MGSLLTDWNGLLAVPRCTLQMVAFLSPWITSMILLSYLFAVNLGTYNLYAKRASFKDDGVLQQFVTEMAGQPVIAPPVMEEVSILLPLIGRLRLIPCMVWPIHRKRTLISVDVEYEKYLFTLLDLHSFRFSFKKVIF